VLLLVLSIRSEIEKDPYVYPAGRLLLGIKLSTIHRKHQYKVIFPNVHVAEGLDKVSPMEDIRIFPQITCLIDLQ
jgi:hypothetical protein